MDDPVMEPTLWDDDGAPETVYVWASHPTAMTAEGWAVTSLDVGSWGPLAVGDRLVALDRGSPDEFLVEVAAVEQTPHEVYYRLRHLADVDHAAFPALDDTRSWLRHG